MLVNLTLWFSSPHVTLNFDRSLTQHHNAERSSWGPLPCVLVSVLSSFAYFSLCKKGLFLSDLETLTYLIVRVSPCYHLVFRYSLSFLWICFYFRSVFLSPGTPLQSIRHASIRHTISGGTVSTAAMWMASPGPCTSVVSVVIRDSLGLRSDVFQSQTDHFIPLPKTMLVTLKSQ